MAHPYNSININNQISSFPSWEQTILSAIAYTGLFLFLFFVGLLLSKKKNKAFLKLSKADIGFGIGFLFTLFLLWITFMSFLYGNSQGTTKGLLFFCVVPASFSIIVTGILYITTIFWNPFNKLDWITHKVKWVKKGWGRWISVIVASFLLLSSIGIYLFFLQDSVNNSV